jgi:fucose permease
VGIVFLLSLAYLAFIGLGLPDPMPGTLWPEIAPAYGLPNAALGLVLAGVATGYVAAGLLAGRLIALLGVGGVLAASVGATALAAGGQAFAPPWPVFVALSVLAGIGGGAVDAALNAFAAARFAPRHLNWMHGCWGIGATLGPGLATALLAAGYGWQAGYVAITAILSLLTAGFLLTRRRWDAASSLPAEARVSAMSVLRNPVARLQMLVFFVYTGMEAGAGQWAATVLTARGFTPAEAAAAATLFWGSLAGGRIGLGFVIDRIGADRMLRLCGPIAAIGAVLFWLGINGPALAILAVALAPVYPTVMARTPARLGAAAAVHAVGFQVAAATVGVAVLPAAMGAAADLAGAEAVPPIVMGLGALLAVLLWRLPVRRLAGGTVAPS